MTLALSTQGLAIGQDFMWPNNTVTVCWPLSRFCRCYPNQLDRSALDFIKGWGKISNKNMFLLDRPFTATPDFRVFSENVALGRGRV